MTGHASMPSEVEPTSIDDLVADCADMPEPLDLRTATTPVPEPREVTIPERAVAVVADLDSYGD